MKKIMMSIGVSVILLGSLTMAFAGTGVDVTGNFVNISEESIETRLELKQEWIQSKVESGEITQEEADAWLERLENCDGNRTQMMKGLFSKGGCSGQGRGMMRGFNRQ